MTLTLVLEVAYYVGNLLMFLSTLSVCAALIIVGVLKCRKTYRYLTAALEHYAAHLKNNRNTI
jgi:hypothetical protein